jgi:hypothetical protein
MKNSYFESTWAASCVASSGGSLYTAILVLLTSKGQFDLICIIASISLVVTILISLPVLASGSILIGSWITKLLMRRVHTNRLLLFTMVGCLMGLIANLAIVAGIGIFSQHTWELPQRITDWIDTLLIASIPVVYLTLAGFVAGAHALRSEQ